MDANRTGVVLTKLAAIFIAVFALRDLSQFVFFYAGDAVSYQPLVSALGLQFLIPIIISAILWSFPNIVVGSLMSSTSESPPDGSFADKMFLVGVSLLGLYTLVFGVIDLLYFEAHRYAQRELSEAAGVPLYGDSPDNVAGRVTNIGQIVAGIILVFGRRRISTFLMKIRSAGTGAN